MRKRMSLPRTATHPAIAKLETHIERIIMAPVCEGSFTAYQQRLELRQYDLRSEVFLQLSQLRQSSLKSNSKLQSVLANSNSHTKYYA
jgi:hypothetical protein